LEAAIDRPSVRHERHRCRFARTVVPANPSRGGDAKPGISLRPPGCLPRSATSFRSEGVRRDGETDALRMGPHTARGHGSVHRRGNALVL